jgi:predicted membrane protein
MKPTLAEQTAVNSFPCWNRENQAIEEMAELTAVLIRSRRKDRTIPKYDIKLELIHVQQSINMLNLIYFDDEHQYKNMYDFEDKRLQKAIDNDKMHRGLLEDKEEPSEADISLVEYREQVLGECSH